MRRSIHLTTALLVVVLAAGAPQASAGQPTWLVNRASDPVDAVVVLIGANDYGLTAPAPTRPAG